MSTHHDIPLKQRSAAAAPAFEAVEKQIRQLIANGNSRSAVDQAKDLHKQVNNAASEALVVDAYHARIVSLREHRMEAEADALAKLILERYPSAAEAFKESTPAGKTATSTIEDLVRPLADAQLPSEQRAAIENELKKRLDDPSALANCAALPADHSLRLQARAAGDALLAVTSGPVGDAQIELTSISRRSPLAPWKALVRAIAAFYAGDDAAAGRYLESIDPESPPSRAAAPLRAAMAGRAEQQLKPAARSLYDHVSGGAAALRDALDTLDAIFSSNKKTKAIAQIQNVIKLASQAAPDLVPRLRQHIEIRGEAYELDAERVRGALGGIALKNAYYWLLSARTAEDPKKPSFFPACCMWEQFRVHAVHEHWFAARGPEVAALWAHMAGLLVMTPPEFLQEARRQFRGFPGLGALMYDDQPKEIRAALARANPADQYYLDPNKLFERAGAADPRPEIFQAWMRWAVERDASNKTRDKVAEAWRRALPSDIRPLLVLTMSAEDRNALQKAVAFLEQAEKLDPLNPDVRRARVRMLVRSAIKRLRERHVHLVLRDIDVLDNLPQARESAYSAVLCALRYLCCLQNRDEESARDELQFAAEALGSQAVARYLIESMARLCGLRAMQCRELEELNDLNMQPSEMMAGVVARTCLIGNEFGMQFDFPRLRAKSMGQEIRKHGDKLDIAELRALGEAAIRADEHELAFAVSAAGLARGASSEARFLLIRAQSLPNSESNRYSECLDAAAELARRNRDLPLLDEIVERRQDSFDAFASRIFDLPDDTHELSEAELSAILKRERKAVAYPPRKPPTARRGPWHGSPPLFAYDDEEGEFDDDEDSFEGIPLEEFNAFIEEAARRAQTPTSGGGAKRKRRRRNIPF